MGRWYPQIMEVTLNIPDDLAAQIISGGKEPSRAVLEALALEGYRTEQMSEAEIRQLLGFETRMEVHEFLKEHGAFLHYSLEDAAKDRETALRVRVKRQQTPASGERRGR